MTRRQVFHWLSGHRVHVVGHNQFEGRSGVVVRREFVPDADAELPVVRLDGDGEHSFSDYDLAERVGPEVKR